MSSTAFRGLRRTWKTLDIVLVVHDVLTSWIRWVWVVDCCELSWIFDGKSALGFYRPTVTWSWLVAKSERAEESGPAVVVPSRHRVNSKSNAVLSFPFLSRIYWNYSINRLCCFVRHALTCSLSQMRVLEKINGFVRLVLMNFLSMLRYVLLEWNARLYLVSDIRFDISSGAFTVAIAVLHQMKSRTHLKRKEVDDVLGGDESWGNQTNGKPKL